MYIIKSELGKHFYPSFGGVSILHNDSEDKVILIDLSVHCRVKEVISVESTLNKS